MIHIIGDIIQNHFYIKANEFCCYCSYIQIAIKSAMHVDIKQITNLLHVILCEFFLMIYYQFNHFLWALNTHVLLVPNQNGGCPSLVLAVFSIPEHLTVISSNQRSFSMSPKAVGCGDI